MPTRKRIHRGGAPGKVGDLLFAVYENGKKFKDVEVSEKIPRIFDDDDAEKDWIELFEAPVLEHVTKDGVYASTNSTGMSVDFIDRVENLRSKTDNPALPKDLTLQQKGKTYVVRFLKFQDPGQENDELRAAPDRLVVAAAGPIGAGAPQAQAPLSMDPINVEGGKRKRRRGKTKKRMIWRRYLHTY